MDHRGLQEHFEFLSARIGLSCVTIRPYGMVEVIRAKCQTEIWLLFCCFFYRLTVNIGFAHTDKNISLGAFRNTTLRNFDPQI